MFSHNTFLRKIRKKKDPEMTIKDDPDPLTDSTSPRVKLSCGHFITPENLRDHCRSQLHQGIKTFSCPATKTGLKKCNQPLPYEEIRIAANLSRLEMKEFETTMSPLSATDDCDKLEKFSRKAVARISFGRKKKKRDPDPREAAVQIRDDLDPFTDSTSPREKLSCGHFTTPETLTEYCRKQLEQGIISFSCPALKPDDKMCNQPLPYREIRTVANLSRSDMKEFETKMSELALTAYCEAQECPQCKSKVERRDPSNLCVICTICQDNKEPQYCFCWQCGREWKGPGPRSDRCDNDGCQNVLLELLRTCQTMSLPRVTGATGCPSIRVCPTCGAKVEHNRKACKNVHCPGCQLEFCFLCLKPKSVCKQTSAAYELCPGGVAPRQTAIPAIKHL